MKGLTELPKAKRRGSRTNSVHADKLTAVHMARGRVQDPWRMVLHLDETGGVAAVADRPTKVVLTMAEMAHVVSAVPALVLIDDVDHADLRAVVRVAKIFQRLAAEEGGR